MVLDINSKDYNNLRTDYSDPNIINRVQGSEFLIDDAGVVDFYFNNNPSQKEYVITPSYVENKPNISLLNYDFWQGWGLFAGKDEGLGIRAEGASITGTISATIEEVIYDKNSISVDFQIDYDTYKFGGGLLFNDFIFDYTNIGSNVFHYHKIINNNNLQNKDSSDNRVSQILDNSIFERKPAKTHYAKWGLNENKTVSVDSGLNINITNINVLPAGQTQVTFEYRIPIWYGWNEFDCPWHGLSASYQYYLNVVRLINFKVRANTISVNENTFDYGNFNEEPYALESNEFLQYTNGEPIEDRMSYETSQEIFEKTERNRMLVSFNLFRLDKLDWDGDGNLRFIRSRDRIKIKDELGNYLGAYYDDSGNEIIPEFEVIRANGKWDGKFYKEIVAKQVYIDS